MSLQIGHRRYYVPLHLAFTQTPTYNATSLEIYEPKAKNGPRRR
jgi:hypothetical protein